MKNLLLIIAGILVGAIAAYFYQENRLSDQIESLQSKLDPNQAEIANFLGVSDSLKIDSLNLVDEKAKDILCERLKQVQQKNDSTSPGDYFIDPISAAHQVRNGVNQREAFLTRVWQYNEDWDVLAYYFPLKQVRELLKRIDGHTSANDLVGIRVYMGWKNNAPSAFMVPVDINNNDIPKVYYRDRNAIPGPGNTTRQEDGSILNNSIPCPNQCN